MRPDSSQPGSHSAPAYRAMTLFVMSGTGNTLRAAKWAEHRAVQSGIPTSLRLMDDASASLPDGRGQLVGLWMPTHGFTAPWLALKFAFRLPRCPGAHAYVVATRASTKLGPWATPGLSGSATWLIALILAWKGYAIRGLLSLDMPSNWLQVHPGFQPLNVAFVMAKAEPRVHWLIERLLSGKRAVPPLGFVYDFISGFAMLPISVLYLLYGRLFFGKLFFANHRCDGCGLCELSCPTGGVQILGKSTPRPYWNFHCESCNRCVAYCPRSAIEVGHVWAIALTVLSLIPFVPFVMVDAPLWTRWFELLGLWGGIVAVVVFWYVGLLALYPLFYWGLKIELINRVTTFMAITRFWRRHKAPKTRLADLVPGAQRASWKRVGLRRKRPALNP